MPVLDDDAVRAILAHMNDDHRSDSLDICRSLAGVTDATAARMSDLDDHHAFFEVEVDGGTRVVELPWSRPLESRAQVREELVRMHAEATDRTPDH